MLFLHGVTYGFVGGWWGVGLAGIAVCFSTLAGEERRVSVYAGAYAK